MATEHRDIVERKSVKIALREVGMSNRQINALLRSGWKSLVGETVAENAELREKLNELSRSLRAE